MTMALGVINLGVILSSFYFYEHFVKFKIGEVSVNGEEVEAGKNCLVPTFEGPTSPPTNQGRCALCVCEAGFE